MTSHIFVVNKLPRSNTVFIGNKILVILCIISCKTPWTRLSIFDTLLWSRSHIDPLFQSTDRILWRFQHSCHCICIFFEFICENFHDLISEEVEECSLERYCVKICNYCFCWPINDLLFFVYDLVNIEEISYIRYDFYLFELNKANYSVVKLHYSCPA